MSYGHIIIRFVQDFKTSFKKKKIIKTLKMVTAVMNKVDTVIQKSLKTLDY